MDKLISGAERLNGAVLLTVVGFALLSSFLFLYEKENRQSNTYNISLDNKKKRGMHIDRTCNARSYLNLDL